jgi:hypothetical protein
MKSFTKILAVAGFTYAMTAISSSAQVITFDENGNANFGGTKLPFFVGPDPSGGLTVNVLVYQLPFLVTPGDVALIENTNSPVLNLSDVVRFVTPSSANNSEMIFYSDLDDNPPVDSLADTGLPQTPNPFYIFETGFAGGGDGAIWTPTPGEPGSMPSGGTIQYNIISDVPEPGTLTLAACGGGLVLAALRRRQSKIQK